jgi:nitroimidazol reductase NimA-like FMN-containing flavoprotein (pyridoxamine 5'-phosphate oxidase superfamily)
MTRNYAMRRIDKALQGEALLQILEQGEYGVLSTADDQGRPYGVPMNYVFSDDCIYFHCAPEGHKLDNLNVNRKASFCVVGATKLLPSEFNTAFESVIVFGEAALVRDDAERLQALMQLVEKYSPEFIEEGKKYIESNQGRTTLVKLVIHDMTGKAKRGPKI